MAAPEDPSLAGLEFDDEEEQDEDLDDEDFELPPAHPAFRRVFSDGLYDDQGDEFAPFGSDEGWDAMAEIVEDFTPLDPGTTLRGLAAEVLELEDDEFDATALDETEDTDFALLGVGFTILRLTGRIDAEGRQRLITAVARQRERFGDDLATLRRIAADLEELAAER